MCFPCSELQTGVNRAVLAAVPREEERGKNKEGGSYNNSAGNAEGDRHRDSSVRARGLDYARAARASEHARFRGHKEAERDRYPSQESDPAAVHRIAPGEFQLVSEVRVVGQELELAVVGRDDLLV